MSAPGAPQDGARSRGAENQPRRWKRRLIPAGVILALGLSLVAVDPFNESRTSDARLALQVSRDAAAATMALRTGDVAALDKRLVANRANPEFALLLASRATPRALGDLIATAAALDETENVDINSGPTLYSRLLDNLAATLALATRGDDALALSETWTEQFAIATTTPAVIYGGTAETTEERTEQDVANRQNLLLLLSRGRWSTEFLMTMTKAIWDWEHGPASGDEPWPDVDESDTLVAPAPNGEYLLDGTVALMAALTANPEAAGWAFTDFQPETVTVSFADEDHTLGAFAHYLFFERQYDSGATATMTALMSCSPSHRRVARRRRHGPLGDVYVLQDFQDAVQDAEDAAEEWDAMPWAEKVASKLKDWGTLLVDQSRTALDTLSMLPVVGVPADLAVGIWSGIEGDWASVGLSVVGLVPVAGDTAVAVKKGAKLAKRLNRKGDTIDLSTDPGHHFIDVDNLGYGLYDFEDPDDFLAALQEPLRDVTYQYGQTAYELSADGNLTHVSGPDREVVQVSASTESDTDGFEDVQFMGASFVRAFARELEQSGLRTYASESGVTPNAEQTLAHVPGMVSGRYFDGLALKADGTYEGIEVQSSGDQRSTSQAAFDVRVREDQAATATLADGTEIEITSVKLVTVE